MLSQASAAFYTSELETDRKLAGLTVDLGDPVASDRSSWLTVIKGKNLMAEARRNKAAVMALADYADSLKYIAFFDNDEAIEDSAENLSSNLSSLGKQLDISADPNESALAQAIIQLANLYTGVKTRAVIREKVKLAHPYVTTIIQTMIKDIERQQVRFAIARLNANINRERWFNAFTRDYQSGALSASQKSLVSIAAARLVEDELKEQLSEYSTRQFLQQLEKTAVSCLAAHKAIQDVDIKENAKELVEFIEDARNLVVAVQDIN